jgi:hypothetical protein
MGSVGFPKEVWPATLHNSTGTTNGAAMKVTTYRRRRPSQSDMADEWARRRNRDGRRVGCPPVG